MKKKYIFTLVFIGILLIGLFAMGTGYGLYEAIKEKVGLSSTTLECFKVYYSDSDIINKTDLKALTNEDGISTAPLTITVTNICKEEKELQLRLNILDDNTVDINSLTVLASGNIETPQTLYKNLPNSKTIMENVTNSKLIGVINMKPNETVHTNIKYWFDEKKGITINPDQIFSARFELVDTASSIKPTLAETLETKVEDKAIELSTTATSDEGLIKIKENNGESYVYRGNVDNNYLSFAGQTWRIIRINSDKSVRIILEDYIREAQYSEKNTSPDYTGLTYIYNNEEIDNYINTLLINWYDDNIGNTKLDKYVVNSEFCNDSNNSISNYHTYFKGYERLIDDRSPSLICANTSADFGGIYHQKVGMISADEVSLAGGVYDEANYNYYLNNGHDFFTLTPSEYYNYKSYMIAVSESGAIISEPTTSYLGIRPVINLTSTITVSGEGTRDNPYTIDID